MSRRVDGDVDRERGRSTAECSLGVALDESNIAVRDFQLVDRSLGCRDLSGCHLREDDEAGTLVPDDTVPAVAQLFDPVGARLLGDAGEYGLNLVRLQIHELSLERALDGFRSGNKII